MKIDRKILIGLAVIVAFIALMLIVQMFVLNTPQNPLKNAANNTNIYDSTFAKADFIYGPQTWKPYADKLPIAPGNTNGYRFLFVDLNSAPLPGGSLRVNYSFNHLPGAAAFQVYGYSNMSNEGSGISWTNRVEGLGSSGYYINGTSSGVTMQELPDSHHIYVKVANHEGPKFNVYHNGTYYIGFQKSGGGLNKLHITTDPSAIDGQVTHTDSRSGTFYITNTGDATMDDAILMVAVSGEIPDDMILRITAA